MPSRLPNDEIQAPLYQGGQAVVDDYEFDPGVCVLPLAEMPPTDPVELKTYSPVVFLRLHAPYRIRRSQTVSEKQNTPPVIPSPEDAGAFVFVEGGVRFEKFLNSSLRMFDWKVTTEYFFVENCVSRVEDGFVLSTPPWTWSAMDDRRRLGGAPPAGTLTGAVDQAGLDARLGYQDGQTISAILTLGSLFSGTIPLAQFAQFWQYSNDSFYPGVFMNTSLANGGSG